MGIVLRGNEELNPRKRPAGKGKQPSVNKSLFTLKEINVPFS
jgi:hypothetical protein